MGPLLGWWNRFCYPFRINYLIYSRERMKNVSFYHCHCHYNLSTTCYWSLTGFAGQWGLQKWLFFLIRWEKNGVCPKNHTTEVSRCGVPSCDSGSSFSFWCSGDCGPPPNLHFASPVIKLNETNFKTGTVLKYNCRPGYSRTSSRNHITCQVGGSWGHSTFCVSKYERLFFLLVLFPSLQSCLRN